MKFYLVILPLLLVTECLALTCEYGVSKCGVGQACIKLNPEHAECISLPTIIPSVNFPMTATEGIYCDQGNMSPNNNSHNYTNTAFAIDFVSNRNSVAGQIFASSSGVVVSNSACSTQNDQCGNGFGNYVQILRDDGFLIFYAHLDEVYVKTGDVVSVGEKIGLEGNTGWTGPNNRHLHFSVHYDWRAMGFDLFKNNVGFLPNSVPFKINACQPYQENCSSQYIGSRDLLCTRTSHSVDWIKIL